MVSKVDQKPMVDITTENVFLYAPTALDKVCFDGWRPLGTQPGDNAQTSYIKRALNMAFGKLGVGDIESELVCPKSVSGNHELIKDDSQGSVYCRACGMGQIDPQERDPEDVRRNQMEEPGNLPHG